MRYSGEKCIQSVEAGFSMIEMLMAAFILAIGLLGLAMLQTMSLRASSGSKNLTMAVQLAEQMMDQVELEGRLTYINATVGTSYTVANLPVLQNLQYFPPGQPPVTIPSASPKYFNIDPLTGNVVAAAAPVSGGAQPIFTLSLAQTGVAGIGLSDVTITVNFIDGYNPALNTPTITRTARITRRILHA
jgi:prepilin-type N-terminal cleavage/methylation domain-containing protein